MLLRVEPEKPVNSRTRKNNPATQTPDKKKNTKHSLLCYLSNVKKKNTIINNSE